MKSMDVSIFFQEKEHFACALAITFIAYGIYRIISLYVIV